MKKILAVLFGAFLLVMSSVADAKGGFSSGGGARGGFSSSRSYSAPSRSVSSTPSKSYSSSSAPRSSTTTTTSTTRTASSYSQPMGGYGGFGIGYGYTNGMLTGLIIGNMMHPTGTVMYNGGGAYNNNALLYPNGQVVNQNGQVVGNYANGQFTSVENGAIVAQQVPADAFKPAYTVGDWILMILFGTICVALFIWVVILLLSL